MPSTPRVYSTVFTLLVSFLITGCSKPDAATSPVTPTAQSSSTGSAGSSSSGSDKLPKNKLTYGFIFGETQEVPNPDLAVIEKQLRATDWKNAQQRPLIIVTRNTDAGATTVKLQGTIGTPNDDGLFHAVVMGLDPDGKGGINIVVGAESKPLETVDAALEMLLLLHNDPQKLRAKAVEWEAEAEKTQKAETDKAATE